ncbi:MAG TPA: hypothetical protein VGV35_02275 [Bryobacteraceae bacterium]|nr:hypothetical protein [Bryobacteraceae bacterium]
MHGARGNAGGRGLLCNDETQLILLASSVWLLAVADISGGLKLEGDIADVPVNRVCPSSRLATS